MGGERKGGEWRKLCGSKTNLKNNLLQILLIQRYLLQLLEIVENPFRVTIHYGEIWGSLLMFLTLLIKGFISGIKGNLGTLLLEF